MYIMAKEPIPNMTAEEFRRNYGPIESVQHLADAFAVASNKFWWVEDNEYDFEEGSPEYLAACEITDAWGSLMGGYKSMIFEILISEGKTIPEKGQIVVLAPFMERYGYKDANGWWVKNCDQPISER